MVIFALFVKNLVHYKYQMQMNINRRKKRLLEILKDGQIVDNLFNYVYGLIISLLMII